MSPCPSTDLRLWDYAKGREVNSPFYAPLAFLHVPGRGAKFWGEYDCLFVSLSVCSLAYLENHRAELHQFLCMLPVTMARFFCDGVAIRYVLPVSTVTSCFHTMNQWRIVCISEYRWNMTSIRAEIPTKFCSTTKASDSSLAFDHCAHYKYMYAWPEVHWVRSTWLSLKAKTKGLDQKIHI